MSMMLKRRSFSIPLKFPFLESKVTVAVAEESKTQVAVNNEGKTNEATKNIKDGDIVLMHDTYERT